MDDIIRAGRKSRTARTVRTGFTLIELTIVLVVIGVVFAIATPRFSNAGSQRRIDLAMDRIERDIRLAEQDAWHTGRSRQMVFDVANSTYQIVGMTDALGNPYMVNLSKAPYNLSISSVDFAGEAKVTLDGRGGAPVGGSVVLADGAFSASATVEPRETDTLPMVLSNTLSDLLKR